MKKYKPTTPGRRGMTRIDFSSLTKKSPEKRLTGTLDRKAGRGFMGRITTRHKGGGHKRRYRVIDFSQIDKAGVPAKVASIEYDPNRNCFIALLNYADGEKRYVLAGHEMKVGDNVLCQEETPLKKGNRLMLKNIPSGTEVYNIELNPGRGGQIVRSAGQAAQILANENGYTHLKLPSTEVRMVRDFCYATIGRLSNPEYSTLVIGKAGRSRWMGRRPTVRGSAMNPCDHPHGGGENRQPIGLKAPKTPWGKKALGVKTRKKKNRSNRLILKRRKK